MGFDIPEKYNLITDKIELNNPNHEHIARKRIVSEVVEDYSVIDDTELILNRKI